MYDWADNFSKSWELWRTTKRAEFLSATPAPAGHQAQGPAPVQVVSEDTTAISPRLAPALNGAGVLSEGA